MTSAGTVCRREVGKALLAAAGWRINGKLPGPQETCIFIGAPHTSLWDTVFMLAAAWSNDLHVRFLVKQEATQGRFRRLLTHVGAIPVDRKHPGHLVDDLIGTMKRDGHFQLVLAPEGTRKHVQYWKSGFYRLAWGADIPIVLATPDGATRRMVIGPMFKLSGDVIADMDRIREFYAGRKGLRPKLREIPLLRAEAESDPLAYLLHERPKANSR